MKLKTKQIGQILLSVYLGKSRKLIAEKYGITEGLISLLVNRLHKVRKPKKNLPISNELIKKAVSMRARGMTLADIANNIGYSEATVFQITKKIKPKKKCVCGKKIHGSAKHCSRKCGNVSTYERLSENKSHRFSLKDGVWECNDCGIKIKSDKRPWHLTKPFCLKKPTKTQPAPRKYTFFF